MSAAAAAVVSVDSRPNAGRAGGQKRAVHNKSASVTVCDTTKTADGPPKAPSQLHAQAAQGLVRLLEFLRLESVTPLDNTALPVFHYLLRKEEVPSPSKQGVSSSGGSGDRTAANGIEEPAR
jgi:hypothetical protein